MTIKKQLESIFLSRSAGPLLFVGSGFSRRYLGLENWKGILQKYCVAGKPFEYYLAQADGSYPKIARLLAKDFNDYWWSAPEYRDSVSTNRDLVKDSTSALRIEICNYLSTLDQSKAKSSDYKAEVELLSGLNVDGIITTNWDTFLEDIFPDYKTYIGQKELLFSNPQQIGEIYKIHGCSSIPESLVLTDEDYQEFSDRNAYLAAKLITLFVEHPIVFIGYSISDENISSLLKAISLCIGKENIEQLRRNLIFIQRLAVGETPNITDTYLTIDGVQIPLVLVKTNNLIPIYESIDENKRKLPVRVLRYCKEQLYELVKSSEPEEKLSVVDIDEIDKKEDVEFVVGVGVAAQYRQGIVQVGYAQVESKDLVEDILHDNRSFNSQQIIDRVIKVAGRNSKNVPVFKYLDAIGIRSEADYATSALELDKWVCRELSDFQMNSYERSFYKNHSAKSIEEIIEDCTPENAAAFIPFIESVDIDLNVLLVFLKDNESKLDYNMSSYASSFRKLCCLYDKLKWGW